MAVMSEGQRPRETMGGRFRIAQHGTPSEGELSLQHDLAEAFLELAAVVNESVADSREKSLALTALEESLMWTGKAIFKKEQG